MRVGKRLKFFCGGSKSSGLFSSSCKQATHSLSHTFALSFCTFGRFFCSLFDHSHLFLIFQQASSTSNPTERTVSDSGEPTPFVSAFLSASGATDPRSLFPFYRSFPFPICICICVRISSIPYTFSLGLPSQLSRSSRNYFYRRLSCKFSVFCEPTPSARTTLFPHRPLHSSPGPQPIPELSILQLSSPGLGDPSLQRKYKHLELSKYFGNANTFRNYFFTPLGIFHRSAETQLDADD